jgi:Telomeric repeat-binding factor 2.
MKKLFITLFLLIITATFAYCQEIYKIGDTADVQNVSVTINSISGHRERNSLIRKDGIKYYVLEITVLNGRRESYEYNAYQFTMLDDNENEYQWCISTVEPKFEGENLQPGMIGRGFLVFGIPTDRTPLQVVFDPGYIHDDVIKFNIINVK